MERQASPDHYPSIPAIMLVLVVCSLVLCACSGTYYKTMEKIGVHKRDILVDRVERARDSQADAQEQFKSALEQFGSVVQLKESDLKVAYDRLNSAYEESDRAAVEVTDRIDKVEDVAQALFDEWKSELELYQNPELRRSSQQQLNRTRSRYRSMLAVMHKAEKSMTPVLITFRDNVLFLKHNLNAQAIGSLQYEFKSLEQRINRLIQEMNTAIESSNAFINELTKS
ncbi:conserved hypothetical protein [Desulforapulum autotrophicum HRM2]|uniref:DUF2959 domain-containing protein n=1 Tax=Desulforapulum autotrophicum (strain ATCC 43914 / DSM 3382 / VKM B-1955 / HRM2) TaxID=177437 RepID=C0QG32_DESAH|nr:DUF2959 domain-containing protein [Desulforapulum autotrophicum]ACN17611.1 conserved hypothetical protein [Desulforapulum autotrophicum HRM2]